MPPSSDAPHRAKRHQVDQRLWPTICDFPALLATVPPKRYCKRNTVYQLIACQATKGATGYLGSQQQEMPPAATAACACCSYVCIERVYPGGISTGYASNRWVLALQFETRMGGASAKCGLFSSFKALSVPFRLPFPRCCCQTRFAHQDVPL